MSTMLILKDHAAHKRGDVVSTRFDTGRRWINDGVAVYLADAPAVEVPVDEVAVEAVADDEPTTDTIIDDTKPTRRGRRRNK